MIARSKNRIGIVSGARRGAGRIILLGAALLPAVSMGVALPGFVELRGAEKAHQETLQRLARRNQLVERLAPYRDGDLLEQLRDLGGTVHSMIPSSGSPLDEFGWVRALSARLSIELESIRNGETHATDLTSSDGDVVVVDEVRTSFDGSLGDAFTLISALRGSGHPLVVLGFTLSRPSLRAKNYRVELQLGFLRRSSNASTQAQQPIQ